MAHAGRINALTEQLVEAITQSSPAKRARVFRACKDAASKKLKSHNFGRTNQFGVQKSLDGLVEKFEVLNKDDLAAELSSRLKRLSELQIPLEPEFLSLLLNLSDRPAEKASVEQLEFARLPEEQLPPALTWEDVLADDPLEDPGLWENDVDDRSISSEEDNRSVNSQSLQKSTHHVEPPLATLHVDETGDLASLQVNVDQLALESVHKARSRQTVGHTYENDHDTELYIIRDVLFALLGLPSTLAEGERHNPRHAPSSYGSLDLTSYESLADTLSQLARIAADISGLRQFVDSYQKEPLLQTFAHAIGKRIRAFDSFVADKQKAFAAPSGPTLVSILDLSSAVERESRHLLAIRDVVSRAKGLTKGNTFQLLDELYDQTCTSQAICDDGAFQFFAKIFLECLVAFLRPTATWMEFGEVDQGLELVSSQSNFDNTDHATFWNRGFSMSFLGDRPRVPKFALGVSDHIFSSGKSVAFLRLLGAETSTATCTSTVSDNQSLTFEAIYAPNDMNMLLSFDTVFEQKFNEWVKERHHLSSVILRNYLVNECGLLRNMEALEYVFLSKDGAAFQNFADHLFQRIDGNKSIWNDTFAIEELAQTYLGVQECIDVRNIGAKQAVIPTEIPRRAVEALSTVKLTYEISWQIQNIIPKPTLYIHQRCLVLLLQVYRSSSLLSRSRQRPMDRPRAGMHSSQSGAAKQTEALIYSLHHRLLHVTTTIHKYITQIAIEGPLLALHRQLSKAQDIDTMIAAYDSYTKELDRKCLFSNHVESARHALLKLLDLSCAFHDVLHLSKSGNDHPEDGKGKRKRKTSDATTWAWSSESDDQINDARGAVSDLNLEQAPPREDPANKHLRLQQMGSQLSHLLSIAVADLHAGCRSDGGEQVWAQLAESLHWESH